MTTYFSIPRTVFCTTKCVALAFLLIALSPYAFFCFGSVKQQWLKHEFEEKLEHSQLHTITLGINDLHWYKKNKELIIDNKLFDVKSIEKKGSVVIVTGLFDDEETAIHNQIEKMMERKNEHRALSFFSSLTASPHPVFIKPSIIESYIARVYEIFRINNYHDHLFMPPAPPPKAWC